MGVLLLAGRASGRSHGRGDGGLGNGGGEGVGNILGGHSDCFLCLELILMLRCAISTLLSFYLGIRCLDTHIRSYLALVWLDPRAPGQLMCGL